MANDGKVIPYDASYGIKLNVRYWNYAVKSGQFSDDSQLDIQLTAEESEERMRNY